MSHYFTDQKDTKSHRKTIDYIFAGKLFSFVTDHGVFSKDAVDHATIKLLETVKIPKGATVLDLGCGYGVIGIVLQKIYQAAVTMSDINMRALTLAQLNAEKNGVRVEIIKSDGFTSIESLYDHIVVNPPIRIGKAAMYSMLAQAKAYLQNNGTLWVVIHKKHGAQSLARYLADYFTVERALRYKGIYVFACRKTLTA